MFEQQQHFVDLQDTLSFGNPNSWLSGEDDSSPTHHRTQSSLTSSTTAASATKRNVDRDLFKDLVEIVPLVQSLIDRKASSSFTRRGSMVYTKTPSRESLSRKMTEPKGRNAALSIPTKKRTDHIEKDQVKNASNNQDAENYSIFSSSALAEEKDREYLVLKEQMEDLQKKLSEKDELLKSAEISMNQVNEIQAKLAELKKNTAEKDSLIKSTQLQLSDAKINLADKQAALEKIQWEAMTSNNKVEKLNEELDSMRGEISSFMLLVDGLMKNDATIYAEDYDITPYQFDHLPYIDNLDDMEMKKIEEAREAYITAVAAAKEKQDEESIAMAANARLHLLSFVLRPEV